MTLGMADLQCGGAHTTSAMSQNETETVVVSRRRTLLKVSPWLRRYSSFVMTCRQRAAPSHHADSSRTAAHNLCPKGMLLSTLSVSADD